jgi:iron-sulfur cluster assembly protein
MFEVSDKAGEVIKQFLEGKESPNAVRIMLTEGGWSGPSLGMALDEPQETDQIFDEKGIKFLINKDLYEETKPINVEFVESAMGAGFKVESELSRKQSGCGTSCSC